MQVRVETKLHRVAVPPCNNSAVAVGGVILDVANSKVKLPSPRTQLPRGLIDYTKLNKSQ